ncbi:MAG: hypothetical protein AAF089_14740 [Bacteroidota bacterium]
MSTYLYARTFAEGQAPTSAPATPMQRAARPRGSRNTADARETADGGVSQDAGGDDTIPNETTQDTTGSYITAVLALLPSEVIVLHSAFMAYATRQETEQGDSGVQGQDIAITVVNGSADSAASSILIVEPQPLAFAFVFLLVASLLLYVVGRVQTGQWQWSKDLFRMLIPPIAFTAWCLLEPLTAIDGLLNVLEWTEDVTEAWRSVVGLSTAVIVSMAATALAYQTPGTPNDPLQDGEPPINGGQTAAEVTGKE